MRKQFPACKKIEDRRSSLRGSSRHHKHKELSETAAASIPKRKEEGARAPKLRPILDSAVPHYLYESIQYSRSGSEALSHLIGPRGVHSKWRPAFLLSDWWIWTCASWRHEGEHVSVRHHRYIRLRSFEVMNSPWYIYIVLYSLALASF